MELVLPMTLQLWKVVFIRGSKITTVLAVMCWFDWAVVQYCHCWVWFTPLTTVPPRCKHMTPALHGEDNVCKMKWSGTVELRDGIKQMCRLGVILGTVILVLSNFFVDGWLFWKIWT